MDYTINSISMFTNNFIVEARSLWSQLGEPYGQFNKWVDNKIIKKGFVEDVDYIRLDNFIQGDSKGHGNKTQTDYSITVDTAKNVCMMENT